MLHELRSATKLQLKLKIPETSKTRSLNQKVQNALFQLPKQIQNTMEKRSIYYFLLCCTCYFTGRVLSNFLVNKLRKVLAIILCVPSKLTFTVLASYCSPKTFHLFSMWSSEVTVRNLSYFSK